MRSFERAEDMLRPITLETGVSRNAEGSCLICCGHTRVLCTASVEEQVPPFLRNSGKGWVTAEYGMLPRATHSRNQREAARGKQTGRTQEIQRLIGRSLRAAVDLERLGERQIIIDCDVLEADGGTRTASITGGYVALHLALERLVAQNKLCELPILHSIAAISCGIVAGKPMLDLDYGEDSTAGVDANFIMTGGGGLVEVQATAEAHTFSVKEMQALTALAQKAITELTDHQQRALQAALNA